MVGSYFFFFFLIQLAAMEGLYHSTVSDEVC